MAELDFQGKFLFFKKLAKRKGQNGPKIVFCRVFRNTVISFAGSKLK